MTIKLRITLGFLCSILVVAVSTICYVAWQIRENTRESFLTSSEQSLLLMSRNVMDFFSEAQKSTAILAGTPGLAESGDVFPNFRDVPTEGHYSKADIAPQGREYADLLSRFAEADENYVEIYVGFANGAYLSSLDKVTLPPYCAMNTRTWYVERAKSPDVVGMSKAYRSVSGEMVVAATRKLLDEQGRLAGVVGIDVSLAALNNKLAASNFGETGSFLLLEDTGRVIYNPKDQSSVGKLVGSEVDDPALKAIIAVNSGLISITLDGEPYLANVLTLDNGWKIAAVESLAEINGPSNEAVQRIIFITLAISVIMMILAMFIVRSIVGPLNLLMVAAQRVAGGDLGHRIDGKIFYGELGALYQCLSDMVGKLTDLVAETEQKSEEAQRSTTMAREATARAEAALHEAEGARREGMLNAANQLEGATGIISSAATQLSAQVQQSSDGAQQQADRAAETASAMNEMNATVMEVAKNAGSSAEETEKMRRKAEEGAVVVRQVVSSIESVRQLSLDLKADMAKLGENAASITQIMSVISDIADQTNLLALNAAIEAARAGEAGRGFAVVADEVRKLAEKTMASTTEVGSAIDAIQRSTSESIRQVDVAVQSIEEATELADSSGAALEEIVRLAESSADQVRAIATASEEQSAASEEINRSIADINDIAKRNADAMEQAAQAVNDLVRESAELSRLIEEMKKA
ncbi:MAG TPA: HAMP domain-containing protein [Candidatus Mailhella merdavium]|nr:HAMP domain-containing protein [Candidatus Mailhella merdavium]